MSKIHTSPHLEAGTLLRGVDGANPLGFLAALGTLQVLADADRSRAVTLAWQRQDCAWVPFIQGFGGDDRATADAIAQYLGCPYRPDSSSDKKREKAQKKFDAKKKELKSALDALKASGLRGNERKAAEETKIDPIRRELAELRLQWLEALRKSVPSAEITLGKHLNATCPELREVMRSCLEDANFENRTAIDLLAAFGSDTCPQQKSDTMQATPFCFTTGSGHQFFLDTVRQLMEQVDGQRIADALFFPSEPSDEKLSMRWDPQEDRRYAVMWSDPTASNNKARTNWAMNLLGYRGLQLCTSVPASGGLRTTGWTDDPEPAWRWPIWRYAATVDVARSILTNPLLMKAAPSRQLLSEFGVDAVYQSNRVQVGKPPLHKINFTPALQIA